MWMIIDVTGWRLICVSLFFFGSSRREEFYIEDGVLYVRLASASEATASG